MFSLKGAPIEDFIKTSVRQTVQHNYNENNTAAMMTFDKIQEGVGLRQDAIHWFWPFYSSQLECCGTDGPKSWIKSTFNNYNFEGEELGLATSTEYYSIPRSCCRSVSRQIRAGHQLNEFSSRVIIMDIRFLWVWVYAAGKHSYRITFKTNNS